MKSVLDLGKEIEDGDHSKVPQLTGRVWEYSVSRVSKSNCVASKRSMLQVCLCRSLWGRIRCELTHVAVCLPVAATQCITMLNSTIEELKEFLAEQEEASGEQALDAVEQDDEFAFDSSLSSEEKALFKAGLKLLSMTAAVLKRGVLTVKKLTIADDQDAFLKWTASLEVQYSAIQDAVVDFGAAMYPPVGVEDLAEAVSALDAAASGILSRLMEQPELSDTDEGELAKGRAAFDKQVAAVKQQIAADE